MNNRRATGVYALLRYIYIVGLRIVRGAANRVPAVCIFEWKAKVPYGIGGYFPLVFCTILDRNKVVRIICPDLMFVWICMSPFVVVCRIIAFGPCAIAKRSYAMAAKK
jgi:hypothetical protein